MQAFFIAVFAVSLFAQETPTEREAARDVVVKMSELEKSIDVPTIVERLSVSNTARDQVAARAKELMDKELIAMARRHHASSRNRFQETRSIGKLTDYLKQHGFEVTMGVGGLQDRVHRAL